VAAAAAQRCPDVPLSPSRLAVLFLYSVAVRMPMVAM
jgi:hypothetical protein